MSLPQEKSVSHRRIKYASAAVALALLASACGGGSSSKSGTGAVTAGKKTVTANPADCPVAQVKTANGKTNITMWYGGLGGLTLETMKKSIADFNASQDKVVLTGENVGQSYDEVLAKYKGALKTKKVPSILYLENTALRGMVDSGTLVPAEACMKADNYDMTKIIPAVRSYYSLNGVLWAGYANVSQPVLYYNKALFSRAGLDPDKPPTTLTEIHDAAVKLKANGIKAPLSLSLKRWFIEQWLTGEGIQVVNQNNGRDGLPDKANISNPTTLKILNWIKQMKDEGLMQPIANTPGNIDQYLALISSGKDPNSVMTLETSAASTTIAGAIKGDVTGSSLGVSNVKIDPTKLSAASAFFPGVTAPGRAAVNGGAFFLVGPKYNGQAPVTVGASWEFFKYLLSEPAGISWLTKGSYLPITPAVANSAEVKSFFQEPAPSGGPLLKVASDQLQQDQPKYAGPVIGNYNEYGRVMEDMLEAVAFKGTAPQKAMDDAQAKLDTVLQNYKQDNGG